jgi:cell division transport system permease protein
MARKRPNYFSAILSVALVLFILGFFALFALYARQLTKLFTERVDLWLELREEATADDVARVVQYVLGKPFVLEESVQYISREQAATMMQRELGEEYVFRDLPVIMRDVVRFHVESSYFQDDSLRAWREEVRQDSLVQDLYIEVAEVGNMARNLEMLGWITLGLGLLLIFAALALIHNTIRLDLFANRFIVKNQQLVGASWSFISRPYIRRGIRNGLWSGLLAINGLIGLIWVGQRLLPELVLLEDLNGLLVIFVSLLLLGILISWISTRMVIGKFLRMRIDDLY